MSIRPLHDHMVIPAIEVEERTLGGILIPDTANEKLMEGETIAEQTEKALAMPGAMGPMAA